MKILIVCLAIFATTLSTVHAETVLFEAAKEKSNGDAQTTGTVKVILTDKGDSTISTTIRVKKTGTDGNAHGEVYLLCYKIKDDGTKVPTIFAKVERTVGAKFPQGVNHKNGNEDETLFGNLKDKFDGAFLAILNEDKKGVPRSIPDLIKAAKDSAGSLLPLKVGKELTIGDTTFLRLK